MPYYIRLPRRLLFAFDDERRQAAMLRAYVLY